MLSFSTNTNWILAVSSPAGAILNSAPANNFPPAFPFSSYLLIAMEPNLPSTCGMLLPLSLDALFEKLSASVTCAFTVTSTVWPAWTFSVPI